MLSISSLVGGVYLFGHLEIFRINTFHNNMAPWCPACRGFTATWNKFSDWSKDLDIKVGVVDVTENPGLSGRFLVGALPTIYHIKDGQFRQYKSSRKENDLISFVDEKKWQDIEPIPWYISPASIQ
ncbi:hypothetical protein KUTeg_014202 [Tegillarca granosa]|uniref:Thioredoxin domain-containing protein n=1 Tax=Tegillarca granosa TaxID=220873 RepID=A0ABQ9F1C7_TEGGR|nr:hypothetical protein KUTeg_014202 [Tegillarca granosa]